MKNQNFLVLKITLEQKPWSKRRMVIVIRVVQDFFCPLLGFVVRSQSKSEIMQWKVPSLFKGLPSKPKVWLDFFQAVF